MVDVFLTQSSVQEKCFPYWPQQAETYGDFTVVAEHVMPSSTYLSVYIYASYMYLALYIYTCITYLDIFHLIIKKQYACRSRTPMLPTAQTFAYAF